MRRFLLRKLIILSELEKASLEIRFNEGLNLILGGNKTGKSTIIKSIFHTFGCKVKFETEWTNLNAEYAVFFSYDKKEYILKRYVDTYSFYMEDHSIRCLGQFDSVSALSNKLMDELNVNIDMVDKKGNVAKVSPAHLFAFQYVGQDEGWQGIGKSFLNLNYIHDWKNLIQYIVGYQTDEYFDLKKNIEVEQLLIGKLEQKLSNLIEFISKLQQRIEESNKEPIMDYNTSINMINTINSLEKDKISVKSEIAELQNVFYESQLLANEIKIYINELSKDHDFAATIQEDLYCPFCGSKHSNSLQNKSNIIGDIHSAKSLLNQIRKDKKELEGQISFLNTKLHEVNMELNSKRNTLKRIPELYNAVNSIREEGKQELFEIWKQEIEEIRKDKLLKIGLAQEMKDKMQKIESKKRLNEIKKSIKDYYEMILDKVNVHKTKIKFKKFFPVIKQTGSELPRAVYSYYVGLYLYHIAKNNNISLFSDSDHHLFDWLVIDTPNQQGQDIVNLDTIFSTFKYFLDKSGQVIVGSERETGFEAVSNVVKLQHIRKCLNQQRYMEHRNFMTYLDSLTILD